MPTVNPLYPPIPDDSKKSITWNTPIDTAASLAMYRAAALANRLTLVVTPDTTTANRLYDEFHFFREHDTFPIFIFSDWETLPYDHFSPHQDIISERLSVLAKIPTLEKGIIITSISTLLHRVCPRHYLDETLFLLHCHDSFHIDNERKRLEKAGYHCVNQVREHGEFAVRGSIIDIFPMGSTLPYRIDLLDNEIDSIRTFSPETQRSLDKIKKIALLPAKEFPLTEKAIEHFRQNWRSQFSGNPLHCPIYQDISEGICTPGIEYYLPFFFETLETLFDYLPENTLLIKAGNIAAKAEEDWCDIQTRYDQRAHDILRPLLLPTQLFISVSDTFHRIKNYSVISLSAENIKFDFSFVTPSIPNINVDHKAKNPLQALENFLLNNPARILFCAETAGRREILLSLFHRISLFPIAFEKWEDFLHSDKKQGITIVALETGCHLLDPNIILITEAQLFGKRVQQQRLRKATLSDPDTIIKDLTELEIGAPIVHIDHGVGRYLGLQLLTISDETTEFLTIEYAGNDKLYVPVAALHLVNRYSGTDPEHAPLQKLGTDQWQRAKRKASEQIKDVAAELLALYAKRAAEKGFACKEPDEQYIAFANAFPFEETPDQLNAINQVISDMTSSQPMDRLVCGDVGFGKTEVAMRAAFLAVQNNKQVAVLVPTTLLAQQHYQNFQDRFANWPIHIQMMSRFKSAKELRGILDDLEKNKIDIVIGTHKLLQDNIRFHSLGLVVVDEEHRFGVKQKDRLKMLRANVDIVTLTATPIPRTLNMAFAGMRDLSLIATPPARRLSVKTFTHEYDSAIIQEAISREILRGGQVYFLHNDVETIQKKAREIQDSVPEARVGVGHGQMHEKELEQTMSDFYHRRFNVLVCTTIIESGIDIPSANTIIINRADKFGLAQLHQLRGRVGRSHHQAYAYLFIPSRKTLTADAEKRLHAIESHEELGIGFTLATHDLEIRGAGELLGEGQSGNIQAIGFTLYMDLLLRAVDSLKSGEKMDLEKEMPSTTEIDLHIPAFIPENYLYDVHLRLQCYKRIASAKNQKALDDIQVEMIDRFGLLPDIAKNLFALHELRQKANTLGIKKIEANPKSGKITFHDNPSIDPVKIIHLIQKKSDQFRLEGPSVLRFTLPPHEINERIHQIENILSFLKFH